MLSQHGLKRQVQKLSLLSNYQIIILYHVTLLFVYDLLKRFCDLFAGLCSGRYRPGTLGKDVYTGEKISHAVVERRQIRQISQIDLKEVGDIF